jgi:hypothetical protein
MPLLTPFPSVKSVKKYAHPYFYVAQFMEKKTLRKPVLGSAVFIMFSNFLQINCNIVVWLIFLLLPGLFFMFFVAAFCTIEKGCTGTVGTVMLCRKKCRVLCTPAPYFFMTFVRVVDSHWFQCGSGSSISGQCLS